MIKLIALKKFWQAVETLAMKAYALLDRSIKKAQTKVQQDIINEGKRTATVLELESKRHQKAVIAEAVRNETNTQNLADKTIKLENLLND